MKPSIVNDWIEKLVSRRQISLSLREINLEFRTVKLEEERELSELKLEREAWLISPDRWCVKHERSSMRYSLYPWGEFHPPYNMYNSLGALWWCRPMWCSAVVEASASVPLSSQEILTAASSFVKTYKDGLDVCLGNELVLNSLIHSRMNKLHLFLAR